MYKEHLLQWNYYKKRLHIRKWIDLKYIQHVLL